LLRHAFELLVPDGRTEIVSRPGASLHHSEAARNVPGVRAALAAEYCDTDGNRKRYVYAELAEGVDPRTVEAALAADPLFANEETVFFPIESIAALESEGHGVLIERRGTASEGAHQNIMFEARFDVATFAARVMIDAAVRLAELPPGLHRYSLAG
jgi:diaminopimelate dehydrogenase